MSVGKKMLIIIGSLVLIIIGYFLFKGTYSNAITGDYIEFDYSLDVDRENKMIRYLTAGTKVSDMIKKVEFIESISGSIKLTDFNGIVKENSEIVVTGDLLVFYVDGVKEDEYVLSVLGDSNGDGVVSGLDLVQLRKHIVEYVNPDTGIIEVKTGSYKEALDVSGDGVINSLDVVRIRKTIVGIIEPISIKLSATKIDLVVGSTYNVKYSISPSNVNDNSVTWSSSDTSIVTVNNGVITALKEGKATITIKTSNGLIAVCEVVVEANSNEATSVSLNKDELIMIVGNESSLEVTVIPSDSENNEVTWSSSDTSVATVNNGVIKALKEGTAIITVKTSNDLSDTCKVTVEKMSNVTIEANIEWLRDPFVLLDNGVYYIYGTEWVAYKNVSGSLGGAWERIGIVVENPSSLIGDQWAPEVYKYNGAYYMFTTYKSSVTNHRGTSVFRSDSPEGPFVEVSNGHITPSDWDSIDGTLYIDNNGQPWMIFVHEWTSTSDGVGRMVAAKLSSDLVSLISEPIELFRADDPSWTDYVVTDGCWMYETKDGQLLMLWSNLDASGNYAVGIARSKDGTIDGEWTQDDELLYSKTISGNYDGGHGMIFTDINNQMYLTIHAPNNPVGDRMEKPIFIPIYEENGTLKIVK